MIPLDQLEVLLKEKSAVEVSDLKKVIQENSSNGYLFRQAAEKCYVNVVKFFVNAKTQFLLSSKEIEMCLNEGAKDENGNTPLHLAAAKGHVAVVECLAMGSSSGNIQNKFMETPLSLACRGGYDSVVGVLVKKGADIYQFETESMEVVVPRHRSGAVECKLKGRDGAGQNMVNDFKDYFEDMSNLFLENQVPPSEVNYALNIPITENPLQFREPFLNANIREPFNEINGRMIMNIAAGMGNIKTIELLVSRGVNMQFEPHKTTPLHEATRQGHLHVLEFFVQLGVDVNFFDRNGKSPLDLAIEIGRRSIALFLLSHGAILNYHHRMLWNAAKEGRSLAMRSLFSMGVKLEEWNATAMIHEACESDQTEIVKILVRKGASVNALHKGHNTPLHCACRGNGSKKLIDFLVAKGAKTETVNEDFQTPFQLCETYFKQKVLIENKADPNVINSCGQTALHTATDMESVLLLLKSGLLVDARDTGGSTPLFSACSNNRKDVAEVLIQYGASVNAQNRSSLSPLSICLNQLVTKGPLKYFCVNLTDWKHFAYNFSYSLVRTHPGGEELLEMLLENGADVNIQDMYGNTPLHRAACFGLMDAGALLIKYKANVNAVNKERRTPLYCVIDGIFTNLLLENGADPTARDVNMKSPLFVAKIEKRTDVVTVLEEFLFRRGIVDL